MYDSELLKSDSVKVGIIMPMYNAEATIERAIDSVINQDYDNWALYIINDCSTDSSKIKLQKYTNDDRVIIINNDFNQGVSSSRNAGLRLSKESVVCFLDSDDEWLPNKLSLQIPRMLGHNKISVTFYNYLSPDKNKVVSTTNSNLSLHDVLSKKFRICFSSVMINRHGIELFFDRVGHEDFLYLINAVSLLGGIDVLNIPLVNYHATSGSLSSNKIQAASWHYNILKNEFPNRFFMRIYYMTCYVYRGLLF